MQTDLFFRLRLAAFAGCLAWTAAGHASTAQGTPRDPQQSESSSSATSNAADELMHLQEQTLLLKAQLKKLDAQAQVAERTAALSRLGAGSDSIDNGRGALRVVAIEGLGRRFSATLQTVDGQQFEVAAGDQLPNGIRIVSVAANEVLARSDSGRTLHLMPVLSRGAAPYGPAQAAGVPGLPSGYPALPRD
ncbi:MAG TPA: type IV pilus biogenesis protein PilP [Paraburkholderia sp.]|jgi:type IV pilus biogenesis protein PilP